MANDPTEAGVNLNGLGFDPATAQAIQAQQVAGQINASGGNSAERGNNQAIFQGINNLFPSPQVQQANATSAALRSVTMTQGDGEADLDFTMRQLKAQRDAVAPINPEMAARLNSQLLVAGNQKFENSRLLAADTRADYENKTRRIAAEAEQTKAGVEVSANDREQQLFPSKLTEAKDKAKYESTAYSVIPDENAAGGFKITGAYDMTTQDGQNGYNDAVGRKEQIYTQDQLAQATRAILQSDVRAAAQLAAIQAKQDAKDVDPYVARYLAAACGIDPGQCTGIDKSVRTAAAVARAQSGISPLDFSQAKIELATARAEANVQGRKEANVAGLQQSMMGLGQEVKDTLAGVKRYPPGCVQGTPNCTIIPTKDGAITRTDWRYLNGLIAAGKLQGDSPAETRLLTSLNAFYTEYGRVMAAGIGATTDAGRAEAMRITNNSQGINGMTTSVDQITQREIPTIRNANATALELLFHKDQYPISQKIIEKLAPEVITGKNADGVPFPQGTVAGSGPQTGGTPSIAAQQQQAAAAQQQSAAQNAQVAQAPPEAQYVFDPRTGKTAPNPNYRPKQPQQ